MPRECDMPSFSSFLSYGRCALLGAALCCAPLTAKAQASPADKAMAEVLYDHGISLMKQGQFTEACPELERSLQVEPGIGATLSLAECYERLGRTASAWATFREATALARAAGQSERVKIGAARADRLEPKLSRLTVSVANAVPGLVVLRNAEVVPASGFGAPVPVDPGVQQFEARAEGYAPWSLTVELGDNAASLRVDVPELTPLPAAERPQPTAPTVGESMQLAAARSLSVSAPAPPSTPAPAAPSLQGPLGAVLSGVGVLGLGLGAYFGARAIAKNNSADDACPNRACLTAQGTELDRQAHSAATLSNVFVIGGAALLVGGAVLYFTRPKERATPAVSLLLTPHAAGVTLGGAL